MEKSESSLAAWVFALLFSIGAAFFEAFVFMFCWNKIAPLAFNLPTINYWLAFGVSMFISFAFHSARGYTKDENDPTKTAEGTIATVLYGILVAAMALGIVALVSLGF